VAVTFRDCGTRQEDVLTYVIDPDHEQYRGDLDLEAQARIIATATGGRGPNDEYLYNTARTWPNWASPMPISTGWRRGCGR
jgi:cation transport regulator ChaC